MNMKKILSFIPFILWLWLCLSFPTFTRNNEALKLSFKFTSDFLTKLFHSEQLALIILLLFIPILSFTLNLTSASREKNKYLRLSYFIISFLSLLTIPVFSLILIIGFGSYLWFKNLYARFESRKKVLRRWLKTSFTH